MAPPAALPFILALAIPLLYSLFAAPLFASSADPDRNTPALTVLVADLDGGVVGQAFLSFLAALGPTVVPNPGAAAVTLPTFTVLTGSSAAALADAVRASSAYGAIAVNAGASARLAAALGNETAAQAYLAAGGPAAALTFTWDEARQNTVTAARVGGACKGLLGFFPQVLAPAQASAFLASKGAGALTGSLLRVLAQPVAFSEVSLFPFTVPAVNQALTVGMILLAVFSLVSTNVIFGPAAAAPFLAAAPPGLPAALRRLTLAALYTATTAAAYATILIGLAATPGNSTAGANGVGRGYDGAMWAQVWAIQWLHMLVLCLWLMLMAEAGGVPAAGFALAPLIIYNALSVNTDVSDPGFKFFYYAPFWHAGESVRCVMFGTLASRFPMHIGVLFLWLGLELPAFLGVTARNAARKAAAEAAAAAAEASADKGPLPALALQTVANA
jgi:hypothetical protein